MQAKLEQVQSKGLIDRPENQDDAFGGSRLGLFAYPVLQAADILLYKYRLRLQSNTVQPTFQSEKTNLSI
jgi:tryptophanyl-tRNA synthetase